MTFLETVSRPDVGAARHAPDPFQQNPKTGPWESRVWPEALAAVKRAVARYQVGEITWNIFKDDGNREGAKFWLWYMHHPRDERWKNISRPNWSYDAYVTWRRYYFSVPEALRLAPDGAPHLRTMPKERWASLDGLHHEHVVPQSKSLQRLKAGVDPEHVLRCNISAVITIRERDHERLRLFRSSHPDPDDPWLRYQGTGIKMIENPAWTVAERAALARYDLLHLGSIPPYVPDGSVLPVMPEKRKARRGL